MEHKKSTKVIIILSGISFLGSSVIGLGGLIATSLQQPKAAENIAQSQNAQLQAQEKGFLGVLKREPNNSTALGGVVGIWRERIGQGDALGVKTTIEGLVKANPENPKYKELLIAIDKQIAGSKNVGATKSAAPKQPTKKDP